MAIKVTVNINNKKLIDKLDALSKDKATMTAAHNLLAKMMDPYVPFDTGTLSQNVEITEKYVRYKQPYAHYMYEGIVYGPNIPIIKDGVVVGYFSRPGITKTPQGRYINYDKAHHPLATRQWDKVMMQTQGESLRKQIQKLLVGRINKV